MSKYRYRNPWHKPNSKGFGPEYYETDVEPVEHAGCLIFQRIRGQVWDVVLDGVCRTQRAGPNGAREAAERIQRMEAGRSTKTFRISLWDHDPPRRPGESESQFCRKGEFSLQLAAQHLEGPSTGLSPYQLNRALRRLRVNWSDHVILVEAEN